MTAVVAFAAGVACYVVGSVMAGLYLRTGNTRPLNMARTLAWVGAASLAITLALRWAEWHLVPLTTAGDSITLLVLFATVVMLLISAKKQMQSLVGFCLPALTLVCLVNAVAGHAFLGQAPRPLRGSLLAMHVGLAILAYALFFVASLTSMLYLLQATQLKQRRASEPLRNLPSLEQLDVTLFRLIGYGYPVFIGTLVLGVVWARLEPGLLGTHWWLAPKIVGAFVMAAFYGICFHGRRLGRLRGKRLAHVVFFGFTALLVVYLATSLMGLREYHFWVKTP